jgi:hypothetical protein
MDRKYLEELSRRRFLQGAVLGAGALGIGPAFLSPRHALALERPASFHPRVDSLRVVGAHDPAMTREVRPQCSWEEQEELVVEAAVERNIDRMALALTGETDPARAWQRIFVKPPLKSWKEVQVAVKTNNIGRQHTHGAVMRKICNVLTEHVGVRAASILIYDGVHGRNLDRKTPYQDRIPGVRVMNRWGGVSTPVNVPAPWSRGDGQADCVHAVAAGEVDILVNMAVCKGHGSKFGGFTMTMKNHFGTFDPKWGHRGQATEYLLAINKTPQILGPISTVTGRIEHPRQQLCIVDTLWASEDGPNVGSSEQPNRLFMGTFSPVVDYQVATRFRRDTMNWPIDEEVTGRFLSEFGLAPEVLPEGGRILDAMKA